jgi:hypothetical protein
MVNWVLEPEADQTDDDRFLFRPLRATIGSKPPPEVPIASP